MDSKKNQIEKFIDAIGLMAEMGAILRDELIKNHFSREEACRIVSNVLASLVNSVNKG